MSNRFAKNVTIDHVEKCLYIDEMRFPFYIEEEPSIDDTESHSIVHIGILADNAHALHSIEEDLTWIRKLATLELTKARDHFYANNPEAPKRPKTNRELRAAPMADIDQFVNELEWEAK